MRVLAMTPEQINMLPPTERSTYIQIVSSCYHVHFCLIDGFLFVESHSRYSDRMKDSSFGVAV